MEMQQEKEEHAIILDFLPNGYPFDDRPMHKKTAIAQAMGKINFTLLELVPKKDIFLQPYEGHSSWLQPHVNARDPVELGE